jgi:hypothetical protein
MAKDVMCKNCLFLSNGWCEKKGDSPVPDMVRDCRHFQQKTNGDRIRAMSDGELADLLTSANKGAITDICRKMHYEHNLQWLKQPAEE